ncbi:Putative transcription elongation factor SPT5 homolog 1 [Linum perenne]
MFDGEEPNKRVNPDEAVAYGAALLGAKLCANASSIPGFTLSDITPLSLGIAVAGGLMSVIVPRNTTIPAKMSKTYLTSNDMQTEISFKDGILTVTAKEEKRSKNRSKSLTISSYYKGNVASILQEAKQFVKQDNKEKGRIRAGLALERLIYDDKVKVKSWANGDKKTAIVNALEEASTWEASKECERVKRALSNQSEVRVEIDSLIDGMDFSESLTRAKFEELNMDLFEKTLEVDKTTMEDAKVEKKEIEEIVLVGGSFTLSDITPLSLGIAVAGGLMSVIVPRNTTIPAKMSKTYLTSNDMQTEISFKGEAMSRRRDDDDDIEDEEYEDQEDQLLDDDDDEYDAVEEKRGRSDHRKRSRSNFIDDAAEEDEDEEEEEDDDDEEYGGGGGAAASRKKKTRKGASFFDLEAQVDSDEDDDEDDPGEDDFIVDGGADIPDEDSGRRAHRRPILSREDDNEDMDALERQIQERYSRQSNGEYDEETTEVEQQALLPSVRDPKLWMVKCAIGHERETAVCLMQKCIDRGGELQIRSAIALEHLKNFIYIEADKEAHVREACKGLRTIFAQKPMLVPIKEMTDVLSVESKQIDLARDTWVRMKIGTYKGDLAKVVDVDNVRQRVTIKLIPRVDLQALASKMEGREVVKKKAFVPPPRFISLDEARELNIRIERRRDPMTGDYFENIAGMMFKDGFLYKTVSMKSITVSNIKPTFDELEKFRKPGENGDVDVASLSTLFSNRKKGHFLKGDAVIVIKGDLKNLKGWVEKVEEDNVHIRPEEKDLPKTLTVHEKELCKYFEAGNHVKIVSGTQEGATGMVVKVEQHVLIILSDTTKEHIRVFADDVVESSEVTTGVTKIGDYELHDLVLLDNNTFGVIIRVESEAFQVLKGVPERSEVILVRLREIKSKVDRKFDVSDRYGSKISVKDVVKVLEGPCQGKQGPVEHIFRQMLFIHDRHHLEHAGFICAKAQACGLVGGSRSNGNRNGNGYSRFGGHKNGPPIPPSPRRFQRGGPPFEHGGRNRGGRGRGGQDALIGTTIKIRQGPYKGYRGRVKDIKDQTVRVELESQMKVITGKKLIYLSHLMTSVLVQSIAALFLTMLWFPRHSATPIHDGMRTPMRDKAWNPYAPMSPPRDNWEEGNPASWGTSPQYHPGSTPSRSYEAPTPGGNYSDAGTPRDSSSSYANAPSPYVPSTPGGQPMTPGSASYLPGTPGGQPMTPGGGLDVMSPAIGDNEGASVMPDILVTVHRGDDSEIGVVREVHPDGLCKIRLVDSGDTVNAMVSEVDIVAPRKSDKVKITGGVHRGLTAKLIGVDGTDGIVKLDDTLDVVILDMVVLAKLAQ